MDQSRLPPQFAEIYQKYLALKVAHDSGQLDDTAYQREILTLVFTDHQGQSWWVNGEGDWFWSDGQAWVRREPPVYTPQAQPPPIMAGYAQPPPLTSLQQSPPPLTAQPPRKKKKTFLFILIPALVVFCVVVFAIGAPLLNRIDRGNLAIDPIGNFDIGMENDDQTSTQDGTNKPIKLVTLSSQQQFLVEDLGWPDAFSISEIETNAGGRVRVETWLYYSESASYTFADGEFHSTGTAESIGERFIPTPHHPDQFPLGSSPQQIQTLLPDHGLTKIKNSNAFLDDVQLYVCQQLILSFQDNRLFYVESLAFVPEGGE
jgi:hypothetical protein